MAVLDDVGISSVMACGHSLGGMVAQVLAGRYPERIRSLFLVETAIGTQTTRAERIMAIPTASAISLLSALREP